MQRDLQELEQRWGLALQNAAFGVWDLDLLTQTVHYSPEWKAMLGYGANDEPEGAMVWRYRVHPDDLDTMLEALSGHLRGRYAAYECEFRLRAADGSYRWVLSRGRAVARDENGRPTRVVGTLTDLTDRREAERLRVERDRAEAASAAKSEFLARMSHELRTPLNAVLGFAQLLSRRLGQADLDEQRRHVEHIELAGWHLLRLIDDVLDLARIDHGFKVSLVPVALSDALAAAQASVAALAAQQQVVLRAAPLPGEPVVCADADRLQQVLGNLLRNAVQYNRPGGSVSVAVSACDAGWAVSVEDTGPGIPADSLPHLFEPFTRLGRRHPGIDGVGIGLVLARALTEAMGGRLDVRSVESVGSVFTLTLPAAR